MLLSEDLEKLLTELVDWYETSAVYGNATDDDERVEKLVLTAQQLLIENDAALETGGRSRDIDPYQLDLSFCANEQ